MKRLNEKAAIEIDYLSLYKCKPHHETDLAKLIYYVMEMRKKNKK